MAKVPMRQTVVVDYASKPWAVFKIMEMIRTLNLPLTKDDGTKALTTQRGNLGPSLIGKAAEPNGSHRGVMRFPPGNVVASMDGRTDGRTDGSDADR